MKLLNDPPRLPTLRTSRFPLGPLLLAAILALVSVGNGSLYAQQASAGTSEEDTQPALSIEAIEITPEKPGTETLCKLTLRVRNAGDKPVSSLGFRVQVAGQPLTVYGNQLFFQLLPAGETTEVPLFNFWTSETGRAAPANGKLPVEVSLLEAHWMAVSTDDDGAEVWKVLDAVPGLPVELSRTLTLAGASQEAKPAEAPTGVPAEAPTGVPPEAPAKPPSALHPG